MNTTPPGLNSEFEPQVPLSPAHTGIYFFENYIEVQHLVLLVLNILIQTATAVKAAPF